MASRKTEEMKQRLLEERDSLLRQRDALDNEIKGIERAIQLIADDSMSSPEQGKRVQIKSIVLDLLEQVGTTGLDAAGAVRLANERGVTLKQNSVSSLLSRLKADGAVTYDGSQYRLGKYSRRDGQDDDPFSLHVIKPA
ncbi:MAG: hypothetical protein AAGE03_05010 [Pseudomonadota bacterium]